MRRIWSHLLMHIINSIERVQRHFTKKITELRDFASDGVKARAPKAKAKAHKAKAKDKVLNRDQLRPTYVKAMTNQHNIIFYDVNIYR